MLDRGRATERGRRDPQDVLNASCSLMGVEANIYESINAAIIEDLKVVVNGYTSFKEEKTSG